MAGWQDGVSGWLIGPKGSGVSIELDDRLDDCRIGVFQATYQVLIWGIAKNPPEIWSYPQGRIASSLVPFEPERWIRLEREELSRVAMGGDVKLRFDQSPIRVGHYILENLQPYDITRDYCAFCNELITGLYYRVGNMPVCPACTEKFKKEKAANRARYYRLAVRDGIIATVATGVVCAFLSVGAVLSGLVIGLAMRKASHESADTRTRITAVVLTMAAGTVPWWLGHGNSTAALALAVGLFAAWWIAARNVRTEISGPHQAKA